MLSNIGRPQTQWPRGETSVQPKNLPEVHRLETDRAVPHAREPARLRRLASGRALIPATSLLGEVTEGIGAAGSEGGSGGGLLEDDGPGGAEEGGGCRRHDVCFLPFGMD